MRAFVVVGLGFGDEGKGSIVDYLTRTQGATEVVRYNGGAQAAHNVVTADGRHHTFSQFGSGIFVPGVRTYLSRFMLVNPLNLFPEAAHLHSLGISDAFERLTISCDAPITTPFHVAANRLRELARGQDRHGSCGLGIGETVADMLDGHVIRAAHLRSRRLHKRLSAMQARKREQIEPLLPELRELPAAQSDLRVLVSPKVVENAVEVYRALSYLAKVESDHRYPETVVFEGAQGVLLDESYGFHPHTTWSDTTLTQAEALLADATFISRVGVTRAYATRHGPGPFPTEDTALSCELPDKHNDSRGQQGDFRVGFTDLVLLRYAQAVVGDLDELAVTCIDRIRRRRWWKACSAYRHEGSVVADLVGPPWRSLTPMLERCEPMYDLMDPGDDLLGGVPDLIEAALGLPVTIKSFGPTADNKIGSMVYAVSY